MPDVFANITEIPSEMVETVANVLEMRAAMPSMQKMVESYLSEIEFPPDSIVLEVGCGTGAVSRILARLPGVAAVTGVDPSPILLDKAQELSKGIENLTYLEADGRSLPQENESMNVVVFHTLLTHVPGPEQLLKEAYRVLRKGGQLGICDGDFATATLGTGDYDPLECCTQAFVDGFVNDKWMVRRLPGLVQEAGFSITPIRSFGFVENIDPGLMMTWVERGADVMKNSGRIGPELAEALKAEGHRRAGQGTFFGHMAYASLIAHKPG